MVVLSNPPDNLASHKSPIPFHISKGAGGAKPSVYGCGNTGEYGGALLLHDPKFQFMQGRGKMLFWMGFTAAQPEIR